MPRHRVLQDATARLFRVSAHTALQRHILRAATIGALMAGGLSAQAADMQWAGTNLLSNRWWLPQAWNGGIEPGAADRAVFSIAVGGPAGNNRAALHSYTIVPTVHLGSLHINATSTVLAVGVNESQGIVKLYGVNGVGARNEGSNMVRLFKFIELQGSQSIEADNAAGGGFEMMRNITGLGVPGHAGITLNGHTLTLNTVQAANRIRFVLDAGITGDGEVIKLGAGTLEIGSGATYNNYTAATRVLDGRLELLGEGTIETSRHLEVGAAGSFDISGKTTGATIQNLSGSGAVVLGANDLYISTASGAFDGVISGTGGLRIASTDRFALGGAHSYTGATQIDSGTLAARAANAFSASSAHTVAAGAGLDLTGFSQQVAALNNSGTVSLAGSRAGTTLTTRAYTSTNGLLRLGAGADAAGAQVADRLVLDGAAATPTGQTQIQLVPLAGLGAATTGDGIEVVSALNGATTTAQSTRDAFRLQGESVAAGAYEYRLYAADASGAGENWYLRSTVVAGAALPEVIAYRPEVPLVAAAPQQLRQADHAMLGNLHLREGAGQGAGERASWARLISTDRISAQAGDVSPNSEGRLNGLQAGTSLWANPNWNAGLYVGQLEGDARVSGNASGTYGVVGHNDLRSQYLGLYATYRRDGGFYVDSVLQGARHRSALRTSGDGSALLKGSGLLASVELGQPFTLGAGWVIEPQLQLMHHSLALDDTSLSGNTFVSDDSASGWTLRLGARVQGQRATGWGQLLPYARVNLYSTQHGSDRAVFGVGGVGGGAIHTRTGGTSAELALGATLLASQQLGVYGELGQLWAQGGPARNKSGLSASLGLRWRW